MNLAKEQNFFSSQRGKRMSLRDKKRRTRRQSDYVSGFAFCDILPCVALSSQPSSGFPLLLIRSSISFIGMATTIAIIVLEQAEEVSTHVGLSDEIFRKSIVAVGPCLLVA